MEILKKKKTFSQLALSLLLQASIFILPLFFWPWLRQPVSAGKIVFLAFVDLLGLLIWGLGFLESRRRRISFYRQSRWLLLLIGWGLIGWLFSRPGIRVRSLLEFNPWIILLLGTIFGFLLAQTELLQEKRKIVNLISFSGLFLVLLSIALFLLPLSRYPLHIFGASHPLVIGSSLWSPLGSGLSWLIFIGAIFLFWLRKIISFVRKDDHHFWRRRPAVLSLAFAFIFFVGLGIVGYQISHQRPQLLGFSPSWAVAVESLKNKPLFGVGPANFVNAFSSYRPLSFNRSSNWALLFNRPANLWFYLWTEIGLAGLIFWVLFLIAIVRQLKKTKSEFAWLAGFLIAAELVLPFSGMLIWLLLLAGFLILPYQEKEVEFVDWLRRSLAALLVVLTVGAGFFLAKAVVAEYWFVRSLVAINKNDGMAVYRLQQRAVGLNRFLLPYRLADSQTDLALVAALARRGKKITAKEKQTLTALARQSIAEAKAGVALEPTSILAWRNLAQTYQQLINLVKGADNWAIAAYQQAISLDPFNPTLRTNMGGIYFSLGKYDQSARVFEAAVNLKPDYANSWYNWAWSLKKQNKLAEAVAKMSQAVQLVDVNSPDYKVAKQQLEKWQKALGKEVKKAKVAAKTKQLSLPTPVPSPKITPIQLSKEAAPQISVTPTPAK